jgi:transketolase
MAWKATLNPHEEWGRVSWTPEMYENFYNRMTQKIAEKAGEIAMHEAEFTEDAEVVVIAYGTEARERVEAVRMARKSGLKVGMLKLKNIEYLQQNPVTRAQAERKSPAELTGKIVVDKFVEKQLPTLEDCHQEMEKKVAGVRAPGAQGRCVYRLAWENCPSLLIDSTVFLKVSIAWAYTNLT